MDEPGHCKPSAKRYQRTDGVIGSLSFVPSWAGTGPRAVEGVGNVQSTCGTAETPRFQQVTPFAEWYPPTLVTEPPPPADTRPSEILKAVKKSLRRGYPEIGFVDDATRDLVLDEIHAATHTEAQPLPTTSNQLLAVGDIASLATGSWRRGAKAIAHATGESGHILRLVSFVQEEWTWEESPDVRVGINAPDSYVKLEWYQDALPITEIKFATAIDNFTTLRWIIVQKASSTTLLAPEVWRVARFDTTSRPGANLPRSSSKISANPLLTIHAFETGGRSQTGVSFKPMVDMKLPQLAIIDECGFWSVWNIAGHRAGQREKLRPVQVFCGHILTGPLYSLPERGSSEPEPHRILWLPLNRAATQARRELKGDDGPHENPVDPFGPVDESKGQTHVLMMCNPLGLYLFDDQAGRSRNFTHVVTTYSGQGVLDVKPSPLHPTQAFVLTNTNLSWVYVAEGTKRGSNSVNLLVSCPHQRNIRDPGLRLDISPAVYINRKKACFVCIRSGKDAQITVVWFFSPSPGSPVEYHRDIISVEKMPSITSMQLLPVSRSVASSDSERSLELVAKSEARFFQLVGLSQELGLGSTLCLWTDRPGVKIPPPDKIVYSDDTNEPWRERKAFEYLRKKKFVLPDSLDEDLENLEQAKLAMELAKTDEEVVRAPDIKKFGLVGTLFAEREHHVTAGKREEIAESREAMGVNEITQVVRQLKVGDWMPARPLLDLAGPARSLKDLVRIFRSWDSVANEILDDESEWHKVPFSSQSNPPPDLNSLFTKVANLLPAQEHVRKKYLYQRIVFETFLSETCIGAGPQVHHTALSQVSHAIRSLPPIPPSSAMEFDYRSSPPVFFSQELPTLPPSTQDAPQDEIPPGLPIRELAPIRLVPPGGGSDADLMSHWQLGSDVKTVDWDPGEEDEDRVHRLRMRKKQERQRRKAEKNRKLAERLGIRSAAAAREAASQASAPMILASERMPLMSSQRPSTQAATPMISMSQVVPGVYGSRVKKAPKKKAGFR